MIFPVNSVGLKGCRMVGGGGGRVLGTRECHERERR